MINREKNRQSHERRRRKAGVKPREQSLERVQPWKLLGMSRPTFYRLPKEIRDALVAELARNSGETDSSRPSLVIRHRDETVSAAETGTETLPPALSQPSRRRIRAGSVPAALEHEPIAPREPNSPADTMGVIVSIAEQDNIPAMVSPAPSQPDSSSLRRQESSARTEQALPALSQPRACRSRDGKVTSLADYLAEKKALALVRRKPATAHTEPMPLAA